jgi:hypothetical protein
MFFFKRINTQSLMLLIRQYIKYTFIEVCGRGRGSISTQAGWACLPGKSFSSGTYESKRVEEDTGQVVCVHPIFKEAVVLYGLTKN